jgi:hypothetical protein
MQAGVRASPVADLGGDPPRAAEGVRSEIAAWPTTEFHQAAIVAEIGRQAKTTSLAANLAGVSTGRPSC